MHVNYTLTEEDLRAFLRRIVWRSGQARGMVLIVGCALLAGMALAALNPGRFRGFGIVIALAMAYVLLLVFRSDARQLRVLRRNRDTKLVLGPQSISLTPEGIEWSGPLSHTFYQWRAVEQLDETPTFAVLMVSGIRGYVVPKRAFGSEGEYVRFIETAKRLKRESEDRARAEPPATSAAAP